MLRVCPAGHAPFPAGPCGPVAPVGPAGPVAPVGHCAPVMETHVPDWQENGTPAEFLAKSPAGEQAEPAVTESRSWIFPLENVFPAEIPAFPEFTEIAPARPFTCATKSFHAEEERGVPVVASGRFPHAAAAKEIPHHTRTSDTQIPRPI